MRDMCDRRRQTMEEPHALARIRPERELPTVVDGPKMTQGAPRITAFGHNHDVRSCAPRQIGYE